MKMESYQNLSYQKGFGNSFFTEAIEGVVPQRIFLKISRSKQSYQAEKGGICRTIEWDSLHYEKS